jgi:uncharacterized protein (UPF0276 family)
MADSSLVGSTHQVEAPLMLPDGTPSVGIAYSPRTTKFLSQHSDAVDHVEIPFELLQHSPGVLDGIQQKPLILHCASLSIAGSVRPADSTVSAIKSWITKTKTPWLGEHLSFVTAEREESGRIADEYAPGEPYNIGYTVSPSFNKATLDTVHAAITRTQRQFGIPILLENPPIYFPAPGSTMTQIEFIKELCHGSPVLLLLDLAHLFITSQNTKSDPFAAIRKLPLERVTEVHISGVDEEVGGHWDNHARRAPIIEFDLLELVLRKAPVRAITLEYNWSGSFPMSVLLEELDRTRQVVAKAGSPNE